MELEGLYAILRTYLTSTGWRFEPRATAVLTEEYHGSWWTRDEFVGWWASATSKTRRNRYVTFLEAVREQIDHEQGNGAW